MDCSTPGFPVHCQLLELTQTQVHQVGNAIQQPHPLASPSPPLLSLSQWKVVAEPWKMLGFLASGGEEFNPGPETRLDWSELLCNKVLLKYKRDRESFWHRHQKKWREVTQSCPTLWTPWTVAWQAPPSMGFSRQKYWNGLPFPSPGDLHNPGIEPRSTAL